jgi:hypothetical protein
MQVLLFLFHQLSAERRSAILQELCACVIECSERIEMVSTYAPLLLARLILLLDYVARNYEAPGADFLAQLKHAFELTSCKSLKSKRQPLDTTIINMSSLKSMPFIESLEYFYQQQSVASEVSSNESNEPTPAPTTPTPAKATKESAHSSQFRPRFYSLSRPENPVSGVALSSLNSTYPQLYKSLVKLLNTGSSATSAESIRNLGFTIEVSLNNSIFIQNSFKLE